MSIWPAAPLGLESSRTIHDAEIGVAVPVIATEAHRLDSRSGLGLRLRSLLTVMGMMTVLAGDPLPAQGLTDPYSFHAERLDSARKIQMLGNDGFGERLGLQTGQLAFEITDVDLPGNSGLPVRFTRRFEVHDSRAALRGHELGDWSIVLPSLRGQFSTQWLAGTSNQRCSNAALPPQPPPGPPELGEMTLSDFWQGVRLEIPDVVNSEILVPAADLPLADTTHRWTSSDGRVRLRCLSTLANAPAQGEGFEALTADGTLYRFDWLTSRPAVTRYKQGYDNAGAKITRNLPVAEQILYASRIQDRFGNWVTFGFDSSTPARLNEIRGNNVAGTEPRLITITYQDGRVDQVNANGRVWTYHYGQDAAPSPRPSLDRVTLPDLSQWHYQFGALAFAPILPPNPPPGEPSPGCTGLREPENMYDPPRVGMVTHPAGATATYAIGQVEHRRSNVTLSCENVRVWTNGVNDPSDDYPFYPFINVAWSLLEKTVAVPGGDTYAWQYAYDNQEWAAFHLYPGTTEAWPVCNAAGQPCHLPACTSGQCAGYSETLVTRPDGSREVYRFGTAWQYNEGKLLSIERRGAAGQLLERETSVNDLSRAPGTTNQPPQNFPVRYGSSRRDRQDGFDAEHHRPLIARTTSRDGVDFRWEIGSTLGRYELDIFARPTSIRHSSTLGFTRNEIISYADYSGPWVLGRRTATLIDGYEAEAIQYSPVSALPEKIRAFGVRKQTRVYRSDGTLDYILDGRDKRTSYEDWSRGIAQTIRFANPNEERRATVDPNGWITSTTSERGWLTVYGYDGMGRIESITPPANPDGQPWATTGLVFARNSTAAFGLPANGHWRHRETQDGRTTDTYYDGLWRPVIVHRFGPGGSAPRFQVTRYDGLDRVTFRSYPLAALTDYRSTSLPGVGTTYDPIGRVYDETATGESAPLTTQHRWLTGFRLALTSPRGHVTTTDFQAWSDPDGRQPVRIESPEGRTTEIRRDVFGKPLRIARSASVNGMSAVRERWYGYDAQQRLCQHLEPETGLTVLAYDAADNLDWSAHGLSASAATFGILFAHGFEEPVLPGPGVSDCGRSSIPGSERIARTYDDRNRLLAIDYPDSTPDIGFAWYPDGTLHTASCAGSEWTYQYTTLGARRTEQLVFANQTRTFQWDYNPRGDVASLSYPDGSLVAYLPNVHGEPTQVGSFASGISRHPDGSIAGLTLGNGIVLTRSLNARMLPSRIDYGNARLDLGFAYDANGNLTALTDYRPGGSNGQSFPLYDGADRLRQASGSYGNAVYEYNAFDDLQRVDVGGVDWRYEYADESGRPTSIRTPGGTLVQDLLHDARGNMTQTRAALGPLALEYDRADTLTRIVGGESYRYDAHGRRTEVVAGNETRHPLYTHDGTLRMEYGPTGAERYVHLDGQLLARVRQGQTDYALVDHQGTPLAWTNAQGQMTERANYTPFGARASGPPVRGPGYTGHAEDSSGLTYMQARYQSPALGRMLSPDPVGVAEDPERHFNRYAYANNNPMTFVDPDGRCPAKAQESQCISAKVPPSQNALSRPEMKVGKDHQTAIRQSKGDYKIRTGKDEPLGSVNRQKDGSLTVEKISGATAGLYKAQGAPPLNAEVVVHGHSRDSGLKDQAGTLGDAGVLLKVNLPNVGVGYDGRMVAHEFEGGTYQVRAIDGEFTRDEIRHYRREVDVKQKEFNR